MNDKKYLRMTSDELDALSAGGDAAAAEEVARRQAKKPAAPKRAAAGAAVGTAQTADALRSRDDSTLARMMELLVDLKTAVSSLETKIERLISGADDSEH